MRGHYWHGEYTTARKRLVTREFVVLTTQWRDRQVPSKLCRMATCIIRYVQEPIDRLVRVNDKQICAFWSLRWHSIRGIVTKNAHGKYNNVSAGYIVNHLLSKRKTSEVASKLPISTKSTKYKTDKRSS